MQHPQQYPPLFRRVKLDAEGNKEIAAIQADFEILWRKITKKIDSKREKAIVMQSLQEACMWACRGFAISKFKPEQDFKKTVITAQQEVVYGEGFNPGNEKAPTEIIVKKKKI